MAATQPLAPPPTQADAWQVNAPAVTNSLSGAWQAAQDPQTWLDAARQWGQAMIAGTAGPEGSGLRRLPMDTASRMARAEEMGFTVNAYHGGPGTNPYDDAPGSAGNMGTINQFKAGPEGASFFTSDPALAGDYAAARYPERSAVYPVKINSSAMITHDQAEGFKSNQDLMDLAQKSGAHVVAVKNASDNVPNGTRSPSTVYMVLNPSAVRSSHAAFDPKDRSSGAITAGVAGLVAGGTAAATQTPTQ